MKSIKIVAAVCLIASSGFAQTVHSLLDDTHRSWQFAVKPEFKITEINSETALLTGLQLGPSLDRRLYIGAGAYGLVNNIDGRPYYKDPGFFDFWYTGLVLEYSFLSERLIHGSFDVLMGGGQLKLDREEGGSDTSGLFVAEPGVNLILNLTKSIELGAGCSYRYVNGAGSGGDFSNSRVSGITGSIFLRVRESDL